MLRIHASYHKCLTMYFIRVMTNVFNKSLFSKKEHYRHFEAIEGVFYNTCKNYLLSSTNGFTIEPKRLPSDYRITRFVRDPRDLVVSGYFYHKRGAEPWFRMKNPTNKYWEPINGNTPKGMKKDQSYAEYLSGISLEEGLKAEIEFRKYHLESYRSWEENEKILLFKYEDILGNEVNAFKRLADHLKFNDKQRTAVAKYAKKFAYSPKTSKDKHIRNPKPNQWKEVFTPDITNMFNMEYGDILQRYGYEA